MQIPGTSYSICVPDGWAATRLGMAIAIHPPEVEGVGTRQYVGTPRGGFSVLTHPESPVFVDAAESLALERVGHPLEYAESHVGKHTGMSVWWTNGTTWFLTLLFSLEETVIEIQYGIFAKYQAELEEEAIWSLIHVILEPLQ